MTEAAAILGSKSVAGRAHGEVVVLAVGLPVIPQVGMLARNYGRAGFQNNFGQYAAAARSAPVVVARHGRDELVVLSAAEHERHRASDRCTIVVDEIALEEPTELFEAIARSTVGPGSEILDYLMDEDAPGKA